MKKLIAIALIIVLTLSVMPMAAFADDGMNETPAENSIPEPPAAEAPAAEAAEEAPAAEAPAAEAPAAEAPAAEAPAAETPASLIPTAPVEPTAPTAPAEPDLTGLSDAAANELISAYNSAVEEYNQAVETYNRELEAYQQAVETYNAEAEIYNAEAARYNAEAEAHNQAEQVKVDASDAAMEAYNNRLAVYEKNEKTIATISERNSAKIDDQMAALGDIGRVDKESIYELGTVLEEDYYMTYGRRSVLIGKAGDLVISWDDLAPTGDHKTIRVSEGSESDVSYKVANLHVFQDFTDMNEMYDYMGEHGWDCFNINFDDANGAIIIPAALIDRLAMLEFEIVEAGQNDTVTVTSQTPVFDGTGLMTPRFFEGYTDGRYWYNDVVFATNAGDYSSDWTGTQHTFSFENGTCDYSDIKNTLNVNRYFFDRYYNPAPVAPETYTADMMDSRELLSALTADGSALSALAAMALRQIIPAAPAAPVVPAIPFVPVVPVAEIPAEPAAPAPAIPAAEIAEPAVETVDEMPVPLVAYHETESILDEELPMAGAAGSWALINLIACVLTALMAAAMLFELRGEDEKLETVKLLGVLPAASSVILFVITENMRLAMVMTDRWTPMMLALMAINAVFTAAGSRREREAA